jgi:hypothetical protein
MLDIPASVYRDIRRVSEFDALLEQFKRRREAAQAAVDRFTKIIELLEQAKETLNSDQIAALTETLSEFRHGPVQEPLRVRGIIPPSEIAGLVRTILLEAGRPMKRGELAAEMDRRQIPLAGSNRNKNLGTILWRHRNEFVHIGKLGYWLKDTPIPGVYQPED